MRLYSKTSLSTPTAKTGYQNLTPDKFSITSSSWSSFWRQEFPLPLPRLPQVPQPWYAAVEAADLAEALS